MQPDTSRERHSAEHSSANSARRRRTGASSSRVVDRYTVRVVSRHACSVSYHCRNAEFGIEMGTPNRCALFKLINSVCWLGRCARITQCAYSKSLFFSILDELPHASFILMSFFPSNQCRQLHQTTSRNLWRRQLADCNQIKNNSQNNAGRILVAIKKTFFSNPRRVIHKAQSDAANEPVEQK
jgi:hypothetical protein